MLGRRLSFSSERVGLSYRSHMPVESRTAVAVCVSITNAVFTWSLCLELLPQRLALAARMNVLEERKSGRILSLRKGAQNGSTKV